MSEKAKMLIEQIMQLPEPVLDELLSQIQGALVALDAMKKQA